MMSVVVFLLLSLLHLSIQNQTEISVTAEPPIKPAMKPDFYTRYFDGNVEVVVDGYSASKNQKIIASIKEPLVTLDRYDNPTTSHSATVVNKLQFYSFGSPKLSVPKRPVSDFKLLGLSPYGFYVNIQTLTDGQRDVLKKKVAKNYGVDINADQIDDILLTKLTCRLEFELDEKKIKIAGMAKDLRKYPLRVDFRVRKGSQERMSIESGTVTELAIYCDATNNDANFEYRFMTYLGTSDDIPTTTIAPHRG